MFQLMKGFNFFCYYSENFFYWNKIFKGMKNIKSVKLFVQIAHSYLFTLFKLFKIFRIV